MITIRSEDRNEEISLPSVPCLPIDGRLDLAKGIYNRVVSGYVKKPLSFKLTTYVDSPAGSGLGASSTLAVAMLASFNEWLGLAMGDYDLAHCAYLVEREDLGWEGGKQDQYAATFGGFNFIEFYTDHKVIVNPLRIRQELVRELERTVVLYYTGTSRLSAQIIASQSANVASRNDCAITAMHQLKEQAVLMKEALLRGRLADLGRLLDFGWQSKKRTSASITNPVIDEIYAAARQAGATGGKISGAGGGGYMMFYCPGTARYRVIERLRSFGGEFRRFQFVDSGVVSWSS
ncbi:MAG TPA: dehydrogenase [Spirochaetia bacterium]|nr:dehydrogenase [Spirochaetia bacterium]